MYKRGREQPIGGRRSSELYDSDRPRTANVTQKQNSITTRARRTRARPDQRTRTIRTQKTDGTGTLHG